MQLKALLNGQKGQGMVEYGLVLSLVSMVAIVMVSVFGSQVYGMMTSITAALP